MKTLLPLVCSVLLLGSCHSVPALKPELARPSVYVLTAAQAKHHGLSATSCEPSIEAAGENPISAAAVVAPGDVKAYAISRTVDARDPSLLHEAHVVYRRETTPRWRLHAPTDQRILIGPQLTSGAQDPQPLLTKELTAFLNEQRRAGQANEAAVAALFQAVERLAEQQRVLAERSRDGDLPSRGEPSAAEPAEQLVGAPPRPKLVKED